MEKDKNIKTFSAVKLEELRARAARAQYGFGPRAGKDGRRSRARHKMPPILISSDVPKNWYEAAKAVMPAPKKLLVFRLDADVVDWF